MEDRREQSTKDSEQMREKVTVIEPKLCPPQRKSA